MWEEGGEDWLLYSDQSVQSSVQCSPASTVSVSGKVTAYHGVSTVQSESPRVREWDQEVKMAAMLSQVGSGQSGPSSPVITDNSFISVLSVSGQQPYSQYCQ